MTTYVGSGGLSPEEGNMSSAEACVPGAPYPKQPPWGVQLVVLGTPSTRGAGGQGGWTDSSMASVTAWRARLNELVVLVGQVRGAATGSRYRNITKPHNTADVPRMTDTVNAAVQDTAHMSAAAPGQHQFKQRRFRSPDH
jgi:hypothetical protein